MACNGRDTGSVDYAFRREVKSIDALIVESYAQLPYRVEVFNFNN